MSENRVEILFDEYALRHARGERPDVRDYLDRAGNDRDMLGRMIDRFLETAPARQPFDEEIVLMQARLQHEPPILVLRQRRKLGRRAVVSALIGALGLDAGKREKVAGYYHELEVGLLDPTRVSRAVWQALDDVYAANVEALARIREGYAEPSQAVYLRAEETVHHALAVAPPSAEPPDEVDRLFTGGN
jgi:hypothetical protein